MCRPCPIQEGGNEGSLERGSLRVCAYTCVKICKHMSNFQYLSSSRGTSQEHVRDPSTLF